MLEDSTTADALDTVGARLRRRFAAIMGKPATRRYTWAEVDYALERQLQRALRRRRIGGFPGHVRRSVTRTLTLRHTL